MDALAYSRFIIPQFYVDKDPTAWRHPEASIVPENIFVAEGKKERYNQWISKISEKYGYKTKRAMFNNMRNVGEDKNRLTTGTLTIEDLHNSMSYEANTKGTNIEISDGKGSIMRPPAGQDSGSDHSATSSAIASGNITITDAEGQIAASGSTAEETWANLNSNTDNAYVGALVKPPSLQELLAKQAEVIEASSAASTALAKTVGDIL